MYVEAYAVCRTKLRQSMARVRLGPLLLYVQKVIIMTVISVTDLRRPFTFSSLAPVQNRS